MQTDGQKDRHDDANSSFSKFCERARTLDSPKCTTSVCRNTLHSALNIFCSEQCLSIRFHYASFDAEKRSLMTAVIRLIQLRARHVIPPAGP